VRASKYPPVATLDAYERIRVVKDIFSTAHSTYDFLNHLLSFRRDVRGRRSAAKSMRFPRTKRLLDLATGTADLAIEAALLHPGIEVAGIDFSGRMLEIAERKVRALGLEDRIRFQQGDALSLPFPEASFDVASIAFGIRNIPDRSACLKEMIRVTAPGGQVVILEMGFAPARPFQGLYRLYLTLALPRLAGLFSDNPGAYHYLADSIIRFPTPAEFCDIMRASGLHEVECRRLTFGAAHLFTGRIPIIDGGNGWG
jgi:demethylmenaquinone methyltransferase/2-methoxy-6-polyprenyl-1,4-benzoquinol methylase